MDNCVFAQWHQSVASFCPEIDQHLWVRMARFSTAAVHGAPEKHVDNHRITCSGSHLHRFDEKITALRHVLPARTGHAP
ncbi:MAG: hypothetical protein WCY72_09125 [Lysobacteraceae bacterium]